ncbi:DUF4255 domain-containing protein [Streptomyces sp. NPDC004779]
MSNVLAPAAVTTTVRHLLKTALEHNPPGAVDGADVTSLHPLELDSTALSCQPTLNVYCYRVTPNAALNVAALPTRRSDGSLAARPSTALDLHYLISCHGDDSALEPQRLLAVAATALAAAPIVPRATVRAAIDRYGATGGPMEFLRKADLADAEEPVKLTPTTLTLEEASQLWGLFDARHRLSLTYLATVAVLAPGTPPDAPTPVLGRSVAVHATGGPRLDTVLPTDAGAPAVSGGEVVLRGSRLHAPDTRVRIGPADLLPEAGATDTELKVRLTAAVPTGVHPVQITHHCAPGSDGSPSRRTAASNAVPLVVRPVVTANRTAAEILLTVAPPLREGQRPSVYLTHHSGGAPDTPPHREFDCPPVAGGPQVALKLPRDAVPEGNWLVRLRVDGIDSVPGLVDGTFGAPLLVVDGSA